MSISRRQYIEQIRRQIYGGQPSSDAEITVNLVNQWLNQAVAFAARQNYTDNLKLEGVAYINNGFYSTFKGLSVSKDENFLWKVSLPEMPVGLGTSDGVPTVLFKDSTGKISFPVVMMSQNQKSFQRGMRDIPNKLLGYQEGNNIYVLSTILLSQYTVSATVVSAGLSTDLDSAMNVPTDYIPVISEYLQKQFMLQRNAVVDEKADGIDNGGKVL